jgi:hypothetical protein
MRRRAPRRGKARRRRVGKGEHPAARCRGGGTPDGPGWGSRRRRLRRDAGGSETPRWLHRTPRNTRGSVQPPGCWLSAMPDGAGRLGPELRHKLRHGREPVDLAERVTVDAHDGQVPRHGEAELLRGQPRADRHLVARGKDRARHLAGAEQGPAGVAPAEHREVGHPKVCPPFLRFAGGITRGKAQRGWANPGGGGTPDGARPGQQLRYRWPRWPAGASGRSRRMVSGERSRSAQAWAKVRRCALSSPGYSICSTWAPYTAR